MRGGSYVFRPTAQYEQISHSVDHVGSTAVIRAQYVCRIGAKTGSWSIGDLRMPNNAAIAAARLSTAPMMDGTGGLNLPFYCQCFAGTLHLMLKQKCRNCIDPVFLFSRAFENAGEPAPPYPAVTPVLILADDASAFDVLRKLFVTKSFLFDPSAANGHSASTGRSCMLRPMATQSPRQQWTDHPPAIRRISMTSAPSGNSSDQSSRKMTPFTATAI